MDLRQVFTILRARLVLIAVMLFVTVTATLVVSLTIPKAYTAKASILIDVKPTDPVVSGLLTPTVLTSPSSYLATQIDIITSRRVALRVVKLLKLTESPFVREQFEKTPRGNMSIEYWLADWLLARLKVQPGRESSVVTVEFKGGEPQFAAAAANAFAQAYIETNLELRVDPARRTSAWFSEQSKSLRDALEDAQSKLSRYQRENGIVGSEERMDVETARLSELSSQLVQAQAQSFDSQTRDRTARGLIANGGSTNELAEVLNQPTIIGLKSDISRAAAKAQDLETQLGRNHPQVKQTRAQIDEMQQKLASEIENVTKSLRNTSSISQRRESEMRGAVEAQRRKVLNMKQKRDEMAVLMREVDSAQKAFDAVSSRATQTSLESQINQTTISVLNPAIEPTGPSSPILPLNIALSVVLGSILGIGAALVLEMVDRRIRGAEDVRNILEIPFLGSFSKPRPARRVFLPAFVSRRLPPPART